MSTMKSVLSSILLLLSAMPGGSSQSAEVPAVAPYGSWRSPITAQMLVAGNVWFGDMCLDGQALYWVEVRPEEEGRYVIVRRTADGAIEDVLPRPYSARTLVHEYGGGAMLASAGTVYFSNYADQRIWRIVPGHEPQPLTAEGALRFADFVRDAARNRLIGVCEDHSRPGEEVANRIVAVGLDDGQSTTLVEGSDFYSSPRISPDGTKLAWLSWNHPNMPWDGTELFVADIKSDGSLGQPRKVAGGTDESIFQPEWAPDGTLCFVSDRSNWWNLYADRGGRVTAILPMEAEFGVPQWVFGTATYGFEPDGRVVARYTNQGRWQVMRIEPWSGRHETLDLPYSVVSNLAVGPGRSFAVVGSPTKSDAIIEIDLRSAAARGGVRSFPLPEGEGSEIATRVVRSSAPVEPDPDYTSVPEAIEFPTDGGRTAHAFYYPPANRDYRGPVGEAPPLLVMVHGGPTSATTARFRLATQ
jgi:dipeptidyl aminopeptidase/acylaminoacyl peptidase